MNILILGSGGREHALAWKIRQSKHCTNLFVAPGNAGTSLLAENIDINVNDFAKIKSFCLNEQIEMVVVGPEDPLVHGFYDFIQNDPECSKINVIGPSGQGAQLEGSKAFAKQFMERYNIPTAKYREFNASNFEEGIDYIKNHSLPIVLKADGLAAGKGVVICQNLEEALAEFREMIQSKKFGEASSRVVVEAFLSGIEMSVFVLTDGLNYVILPNAKDYKRIGEGDTGLNTGGMGAISPVPFADQSFLKKVEEKIIKPTIEGINKEKITYKGFVFIGLIKVDNEPFVIEYNCRMGDPETEVVLPRLENDLVELLQLLPNNKLLEAEIIHKPEHAATIVLVSGGYPGEYEKGKKVEALTSATDSIVFHAGTIKKDEQVFTNGGRVFAITSLAIDLRSAVANSLANAAIIQFEHKYYRSDIGYEFM